MALRNCSTRCDRRIKLNNVNYSYWIAGGVLLAVILIVVFVPGVAEGIERRLLGFLAGWGR